MKRSIYATFFSKWHSTKFMFTKKYDIVSIGSATRDVLLKSANFESRQHADSPTSLEQCFTLGSKIEIAKQIGNAVPTLLAARIADSVYALLQLQLSGGHFQQEETQLDHVARPGR